MTALNILPPFPTFTDADGTPLDAGYIYIGTANLPPQTNPIAVYWDEALTIAAAQPIRTTNGYPSRAGTPARVYVGSRYSILVTDSKNVPVLSAPESFDYATVEQVQDSSLQYLTSVSGTNTITASASVAPTAYAAGQTFRFVSAGANTGLVTLNVNGLGAKAVTKRGTTPLAADDIPSGSVVTVTYDGTRFQLLDAATAVSQSMSTARVLGRTTAGSGAVEELTANNGLTLSGGSLSGSAASATAVGVVELATDAETQTGTDTTRAVTPASFRSANIVLGTAVTSTSGTSIDFTGIPSWAKRVTVLISGVSTSGTSSPIVQIGDSGGIETTSYLAAGSIHQMSQLNSITTFTNGFPIAPTNAAWGATAVFQGAISIEKLTGNTWIARGMFYNSTATVQTYGSTGSKSLSDVLDRIRITTDGGTDTFDAGTINVSWE